MEQASGLPPWGLWPQYNSLGLYVDQSLKRLLYHLEQKLITHHISRTLFACVQHDQV